MDEAKKCTTKPIRREFGFQCAVIYRGDAGYRVGLVVVDVNLWYDVVGLVNSHLMGKAMRAHNGTR
jgi:hypothetical protein